MGLWNTQIRKVALPLRAFRILQLLCFRPTFEKKIWRKMIPKTWSSTAVPFFDTTFASANARCYAEIRKANILIRSDTHNDLGSSQRHPKCHKGTTYQKIATATPTTRIIHHLSTGRRPPPAKRS
ncbi:PREDICTED: uncharacterized protein LOC108520795 [Rhinopithecus bieti]|uniref:uncharacterized protein LOC108520795 n=1 Tax=Rhinopithecus bieti TaxID=61621 RepID=UPI00083BCE13|nr:PREDICTED: uncharacterized protein LOC108520795 [Rhinopithecus bieti]